MIESYSFGHMTIDGEVYRKDLIILPDGEILHPWWRDSGHRLTLADLDAVMDAAPQTLIVGTGSPGMMAPADGLIETLAARGIETTVLPTAQAADTYNANRNGGTRIAACFPLTC